MSTSDPGQRYDVCPLCEDDYDNVVSEASSQRHEVRDSAEACRYQEAKSSFRLIFVHMGEDDD